MRVIQINRQAHFGGGEVYTAFLCRALAELDCPTILYTHPAARFWEKLGLPESTERIAVPDVDSIPSSFPRGALWILGHGPLPKSVLSATRRDWRLTAIAHMPVQGRKASAYYDHDLIFPVSGWVRDGLVAAGLAAWDEPLYGVADLEHRPAVGEIHRTSRYDWDRRKVRDRLLGLCEPLVSPFQRRPRYERRPGLTIGIVSRLTPIKQFPKMFSIIAPILADFPALQLEIFGSGGYASVRDLERALAPLSGRARFWGHQTDVRAIYRSLDFLLTGLPEKEALGLNVIEAQACNLPVLAVNAPPFTETVAEGLSGWLFRDPREDAGEDFARLIARLSREPNFLSPAQATEHLARFSFAAFTDRIGRALDWAKSELLL